MKPDTYVICANCRNFKGRDRYHGDCRSKTVTVRAGDGTILRFDLLKRRWNDDARNCEAFQSRI